MSPYCSLKSPAFYQEFMNFFAIFGASKYYFQDRSEKEMKRELTDKFGLPTKTPAYF